jgi:4-hydroxy-tetrahydrodipicolinate reductase
MKYALVGYGKMGRAVEAAAAARGHRRVAVVDRARRGAARAVRTSLATLRRAEVAFEFTEPGAAEDNVVELLGAGLHVVSGTTGWDPRSTRIRRALRATGRGLVASPNFSPGMELFARLVGAAADLVSRAGLHDPWILDLHHRAKLDAPSGTAKLLAEIVEAHDPRVLAVHAGPLDGRLEAGALHVASVRAGHETGTHVVGFDGEHDALTLTHRTRGRSGLALGAVLAGEWILARRGLHGFDAVMDDLLSRRPGRAGRRRGRR